MTVLLLSVGGGGGNILRSLKLLYRRDLEIGRKVQPKYAERLRRAVATRFVDTNEFSLSDIPEHERLLIGAAKTRRLGSMHNPELAREALEESRAEVKSLLSGYSVIVVIGTGGKGTGAGTIFPIAQMARELKKLVIPVFVRPSFERHEVEKRRYDHALKVVDQFDAAKIRIIEVLNDRGYSDANPESQAIVWERMNRPIARGLRGLLHVLWDLSQVDPSDLSALFGGPGRLCLGFSEIEPPAGQDPRDEQVEEAVRGCWENPYYAFAKPVGTSLVCIHGDWSNVVDGKIKAKLAILAGGSATDAVYNPLYARASHAPKPWGITALFAEYTGNHPPLEIEWPIERTVSQLPAGEANETLVVAPAMVVTAVPPAPEPLEPNAAEPQPGNRNIMEQGSSYSSFWEFALAVNRSNPRAVALANNGVAADIPMDASELRKLLGTFWFRSVFARLSREWQHRVLKTVLESVTIPNHTVRIGRRTVHLSQLTLEELKQVVTETILPDAIRTDVQLLVTVGTLWGHEALERFEFTSVPERSESSKTALWRHASQWRL